MLSLGTWWDIDKLLLKVPYCRHQSVRQSTNIAKILNYEDVQ